MQFRLNKIDWQKLSEDRNLKINIGLAIILIVIFAFFIDIVFSIYRYRYQVETGPKKEQVIKKETRPLVIKKPEAAVKKAVKSTRAVMVAIILDDAGGKAPDYASIYAIKQRMTLSVIPNLPTSARVASEAKQKGIEIMLHLPMEAENGEFTRQGSDMVTCMEDDATIKSSVHNSFMNIKYAAGFNNHMGSKATKDERVMRSVFDSLKGLPKQSVWGKSYYFVDSHTSNRSIAISTARKMGIPSAENNVFLDGGTSSSYIEGKLRELIAIAKRNGSAIGIGHATRRETIEVLQRMLPKYADEGIKFVHVSELVK